MDEEDHCVIKCSRRCCINKDPLLQSDLDLQYTYKKVIRSFTHAKLYAHRLKFKMFILSGQLPYAIPNGSNHPASWYLVIHSRAICVPERQYSRLPFPRTGPSSVVPIQPGLFKLTTAFIRGYPDMVDIRVCPTKSLVMLTYDEIVK